jgi:hypothetical protein
LEIVDEVGGGGGHGSVERGAGSREAEEERGSEG